MLTEQENRTTTSTTENGQTGNVPAPVLTPLVAGIVDDVQNLIKQQLTLFQTEITHDLKRTRNATIPMIAGGLVAMLAVIVLLIGLAHLLCWIWPTLPLFAG